MPSTILLTLSCCLGDDLVESCPAFAIRPGSLSQLPRCFSSNILFGIRRAPDRVHYRWEDVHIDARELRLADSKTGPRTISLSAEAADVLAAIDRLPGNPWVIPGTRPGQRLSSIFGPWRRVRARAGLDDVRIHDLRHSYASRALALGESLPVIAKLLGHAQIQTTARYTHLTRDAVKDAATRVANHIAEDIFPANTVPRTRHEIESSAVVQA